jgi:drug/metabolite transporter (DMT)-like permease
VLGAIALVARRRQMPTRRDAVRLALLGVLGHGLYQLLFILGIDRSTAGTAALVMAAGPAFTGIVGRLLGVERPSTRAWAGIAFQLAGMAGVVYGSTTHTAGQADATLLGPALILAAALAWACYAVLLKPFSRARRSRSRSRRGRSWARVTSGVRSRPRRRLDWLRASRAWFAVGYSAISRWWSRTCSTIPACAWSARCARRCSATCSRSSALSLPR